MRGTGIGWIRRAGCSKGRVREYQGGTEGDPLAPGARAAAQVVGRGVRVAALQRPGAARALLQAGQPLARAGRLARRGARLGDALRQPHPGGAPSSPRCAALSWLVQRLWAQAVSSDTAWVPFPWPARPSWSTPGRRSAAASSRRRALLTTMRHTIPCSRSVQRLRAEAVWLAGGPDGDQSMRCASHAWSSNTHHRGTTAPHFTDRHKKS